MDLAFNFLEKGKLEREFCIGKQVNCDDDEYMKSIPSSITITYPDLVAPSLTLKAPFILCGALVYMLADAVGLDAEAFLEKPFISGIREPVINAHHISLCVQCLPGLKTVHRVTTDIAELGLADVTITLGYHIALKVVTITLAGSPELGNDCDNWFMCKVEDLGEKINLEISLELNLGVVRRCLCLDFPLPSWLKQCLCLVCPRPS